MADDAKMKDAIRWMWSLGDYGALAEHLEPHAIELAQRSRLQAGLGGARRRRGQRELRDRGCSPRGDRRGHRSHPRDGRARPGAERRARPRHRVARSRRRATALSRRALRCGGLGLRRDVRSATRSGSRASCSGSPSAAASWRWPTTGPRDSSRGSPRSWPSTGRHRRRECTHRSNGGTPTRCTAASRGSPRRSRSTRRRSPSSSRRSMPGGSSGSAPTRR